MTDKAAPTTLETPTDESPVEVPAETTAETSAPETSTMEAGATEAGPVQADPIPVEKVTESPVEEGNAEAETSAEVDAVEAEGAKVAEIDAVEATPAEPEKPAGEPAVEAAAVPVQEEDTTDGGVIEGLRQAKEAQTAVEGRVIGWNNGGFHVVIGELTAFCPRSEMEIASPKAPRNYLDKSFHFHVLKVQKKGRRVVLSRATLLRGERSKQREEIRDRLSPGTVVKGKVASLTDFGAFVDVGGVQGLVHVSEISRNRIDSPADVLEVGQEIEVKVLKLEKGGRRISLSIRALEPDPWRGVKERFAEGSTFIGKVEKATNFGAFIELEPGVTGLLPLSAMSIPRDTSPARVYPPGRKVKVLVMGVDTRRRRISLALEGSTLEGTRNDYKSFVNEQKTGSAGGSGFNALADAFKRLDGNVDS